MNLGAEQIPSHDKGVRNKSNSWSHCSNCESNEENVVDQNEAQSPTNSSRLNKEYKIDSEDLLMKSHNLKPTAYHMNCGTTYAEPKVPNVGVWTCGDWRHCCNPTSSENHFRRYFSSREPLRSKVNSMRATQRWNPQSSSKPELPSHRHFMHYYTPGGARTYLTQPKISANQYDHRYPHPTTRNLYHQVHSGEDSLFACLEKRQHKCLMGDRSGISAKYSSRLPLHRRYMDQQHDINTAHMHECPEHCGVQEPSALRREQRYNTECNHAVKHRCYRDSACSNMVQPSDLESVDWLEECPACNKEEYTPQTCHGISSSTHQCCMSQQPTVSHAKPTSQWCRCRGNCACLQQCEACLISACRDAVPS